MGSGRTRLKLVLLGVVLLGLGGIMGFSLSREIASPVDAGRGAASGPPRIAARPALSADEQAYVEALWPIHTDVEVAAERVGLGAIFYRTNDLDRTELKTRLDGAPASYRAADQKLRALHPPASLESSHATYLSAVGLLKLFDDGREDHLQVNTTRGQIVFGSDAYSSYEGIRDWNVANIQQTDTVQQFLAYEKCYVLAAPVASAIGGAFDNCPAAHERLSYSSDYPITHNWWTIPNGNCSRAAELTLAPGQRSLVPANVATGTITVNGHTVAFRIDATTCKNTIAVVPPHTIQP